MFIILLKVIIRLGANQTMTFHFVSIMFLLYFDLFSSSEFKKMDGVIKLQSMSKIKWELNLISDNYVYFKCVGGKCHLELVAWFDISKYLFVRRHRNLPE